MNVKSASKRDSAVRKSNDVRALKALKKELDTLKKAPANAIRNSIGVNEKGFTRFNHKPDNMIVTSKDAGKIIGSINWEGQRWDWGLTVRTPSPAIQKVVTINPFI
jgi:hypothetical protein